MCKTYLVFTDLDGTLLDHHSYSHQAALPALDLLAAQQIPVILNSSKTLDEMEHIASDLSLSYPRIAENGSVVFYPDTQTSEVFSGDYQRICDVINDLRKRFDFKFVGFNDWTAEQIADDTGLSVAAAERAANRHGSEPITWLGDEPSLNEFKRQLAQSGLTLNRGGRYWHVMWEADKAQAMQHLIDAYSTDNTPPITIALGDGPNDINMLAAVDIAVIVNNPYCVDIDLPSNNNQQVIRTTLEGPNGWNDAIHQIIDPNRHKN